MSDPQFQEQYLKMLNTRVKAIKTKNTREFNGSTPLSRIDKHGGSAHKEVSIRNISTGHFPKR